jgi:hypothetical protein
MISEKDLAELENIPYEQRIERVEKLLEGKTEPRAFELGLLLALKMGQEIREGKELGSESGDLVASWNGKFPESVVEEAIAFAKEFLMNPAKIAEKIKSGMLKAAEKGDPPLKGATRTKATSSQVLSAGSETGMTSEAAESTDEDSSPTCHPERSDSEVEGSNEAQNG